MTEHLPTITDRGRNLVPHRFVSEALDAQVKWDDTRTR
ncbi:stalk domain-containing protein [Paenibacillus sp. UNC217MF]